ncbi:tripartite tricarboxylate transporter substrate binding protein [Salipiger mangrovisoli]|uniref:Tripartite tricarboxylate transporter substrate binding protein n=1 Tax=Salipiger mangrovisoli TaxID=2865933 RepID=A0ABR9X875_9RHOB|nr:tripartite tricarboxylate transporter substrate binding protein [Salipiger mangrovisoli]MBE9639652.1 tripartite tricarboxylate transporter substrate binding protein [Salipiger mangrovisoli]
MKTHVALRAALAGLALCATAAFAPAQAADTKDVTWPKGSVRLVTPIKPGGGTDAVARLIAGELQKQTGAPFVVVNQPAGGGGVAVNTVQRARPDGQTLFFFNSAIIHRAHTGLINASPSEDFTTLAFMAVKASYCVVVSNEAEFDTFESLVAASKAAPDSITFGVQLKSGSHFGGALIQRETQSAFRFVQGGGDSDLTVAIEGGNIDTGLVSCSTAVQHRDAGKLKILATVSRNPERDALVPDVPTIPELGYPEVAFSLDFLLLGPKDMDPALAETINAAFAEVIADPAITEQLTKMRIPMTTLPLEESAAMLAESDATVGALAKDLGFE